MVLFMKAAAAPSLPAKKLTFAPTVLLAAVSLLVVVICAIIAPAPPGKWGAEALKEDDYTVMRPLMGYFSRYAQNSPFATIYKEYFLNVVRNTNPAMKDLANDDFRRLRPTGLECQRFLKNVRTNKYIMMKPYDIVILDACLDWFYGQDKIIKEERERELKLIDRRLKKALDDTFKDAKLKAIYKNTRLKSHKEVPEELREKLYDYVTKQMKIFADDPKSGCHSLWLDSYNEFIEDVYLAGCDSETECTNHFDNLENSDQDSYLNMIVESTKEAGRKCYETMQEQVRDLMEAEFENSKSIKGALAKRFLSKSAQVRDQMDAEKWTREMVIILQLAAGVNRETRVNLGDVVSQLYEIKNGKEETIERFTRALGEYAENAEIKQKDNTQYGHNRFGHAMIKLCGPFVDRYNFMIELIDLKEGDDEVDERKAFDFYPIINSLVKLTNYKTIFGHDKDDLETDIVANEWEALYLATFTCQVISTAWAQLSNAKNKKALYTVTLSPEYESSLEEWPIEIMHERLPQLDKNTAWTPLSRSKSKSSSSSSSSGGGGDNSNSGGGFTFGKMKFGRPKSPARSENQVTRPMEVPMKSNDDNIETAQPPPPVAATATATAATTTTTSASNNESSPASTPNAFESSELARATPSKPGYVMPYDMYIMFKNLHKREPNLPRDVLESYRLREWNEGP